MFIGKILGVLLSMLGKGEKWNRYEEDESKPENMY